MCWFKPKKQKSMALSAGVVFTDGKLMLCGYQPNKIAPYISGIGGTCEPGEDLFTCAIREMIEELFEIKYSDSELSWAVKEVTPRTAFTNHGYYIVMYSFEDLERILRAIDILGLQSPLYDVFPTNLNDLLFKRKTDNIFAEISHLALLPVVHHGIENSFVDSYVIDDMKAILARCKELTK
jgi:hypothetical protein